MDFTANSRTTIHGVLGERGDQRVSAWTVSFDVRLNGRQIDAPEVSLGVGYEINRFTAAEGAPPARVRGLVRPLGVVCRLGASPMLQSWPSHSTLCDQQEEGGSRCRRTVNCGHWSTKPDIRMVVCLHGFYKKLAEARESFSAPQLDLFHATWGAYHGPGNADSSPPGAPTRGEREVGSHKEVLRQFPQVPIDTVAG